MSATVPEKMEDQMTRKNHFKKIEDAPRPEHDGQKVYVEIDSFADTEYVAVNGEWKAERIIYPATMD